MFESVSKSRITTESTHLILDAKFQSFKTYFYSLLFFYYVYMIQISELLCINDIKRIKELYIFRNVFTSRI